MKILSNKKYERLMDEVTMYKSSYYKLVDEYQSYRKRNQFFESIKIKELEKENNELKAKLLSAYGRIGGLSRCRNKK